MPESSVADLVSPALSSFSNAGEKIELALG
jgi:hypothetical protein